MNRQQLLPIYPVYAINVLIDYSLCTTSVELTGNFAVDFRGRRIEPCVTISPLLKVRNIEISRDGVMV